MLTPRFTELADALGFGAPSWAAWRAALAVITGQGHRLDPTLAALARRCLGTDAPFPTTPAREVWIVCGRRAGKSHITAFMASMIGIMPMRRVMASGERFCCNFGPATSGWTVFDNDWTGSPIMPSDNPFKWRQFEPGLILLCVRWYLRYAVSYRDLEEMMRERGLCVDHTTIYRWVQRYAPEIDKRCRPFLRRTTDSYRIDETYVRVGGAWHYLYRGVDSNGDTLDFLLRATRDRNAAIAFFRKTVGASHTTPPRVVNVDKNPAYPIAVEAIKHEGFFRPRSSLRQCKYLNNVIEQDHRFIKRRTRPMLGFKRFTTAWRTVRGIEIMHALRKGQARWMAKGDVVGQTRLIHKVFGLAV